MHPLNPLLPYCQYVKYIRGIVTSAACVFIHFACQIYKYTIDIVHEMNVCKYNVYFVLIHIQLHQTMLFMLSGLV